MDKRPTSFHIYRYITVAMRRRSMEGKNNFIRDILVSWEYRQLFDAFFREISHYD